MSRILLAALLLATLARAELVEVGVLTASPGCRNPSFAAGPATGPLQMRLLCDQATPVPPNCPSPPGAGVPACPVDPANINCGSAYSATKVIDARFDLGAGYRYYTERQGTFTPSTTPPGFGADAIIVTRFTAPAAGDASLVLEAYESQPPPAVRTYVLSTLPCDVAVPKSSSALYANDKNQQLSLALRTDGNCSFGQYCLVPGKTYYLMAINKAGGLNTCSSAGFVQCNIFQSFYNPR